MGFALPRFELIEDSFSAAEFETGRQHTRVIGKLVHTEIYTDSGNATY